MEILSQLKRFCPSDEKEAKDTELLMSLIKKDPSCFSREREEGHVTASAWIVNPEKTRVLFCYHKLYDSWSWVGGHADGEKDLRAVALKEAKEETGIENFTVSRDILSVELLPVKGHIKKGKYVPSHLHYNATYLLEASENEPLKINPDENTGLMWIDIKDIEEYSTEKWMCENVYSKIRRKLINY
ncbi:MAG: NUDIX domain-containing protein [Ruminococcaceae bacterium]|nr:NUDIX domain-containing protein [Oscillospiraceae bacterium]MBR3596712.1 NUDIX hydrolase [Clostridia bacterium]